MTTQVKRPAKRDGKGTLAPILLGSSRDARVVAAAILEVLGGARSPQQAAQALSVSLPRYYALEARGLTGMVTACEPRIARRGVSPDRELERLRREVKQLEREAARYRTLARTTQRALGLAAPPEPSAKANGKRRRPRKPTVRALKAAAVLQSEPASPVPPSQGTGVEGDRS